MESYFDRTIQALGQETFDHLQRVRVILFGAGGVGGWCAEALVRTGVKHLTIVDFDVVNPSNINRQVVATRDNIGAPKVKELQKRLLAINPDAEITTINQRYSAQTAEAFDFNSYDYVLDAIDSVKDKALLLYRASRSLEQRNEWPHQRPVLPALRLRAGGKACRRLDPRGLPYGSGGGLGGPVRPAEGHRRLA